MSGYQSNDALYRLKSDTLLGLQLPTTFQEAFVLPSLAHLGNIVRGRRFR